MIVVGVDPGTANCGFAVLAVDRPRIALADLGCFRSDKDQTIPERMDALAGDLLQLLSTFQPDVVVCESPTFPRRAGSAAQLFGAFGVLVGLCKARGVLLSRQQPVAWRKALGLQTGKATPEETMAMRPHQPSPDRLSRLRKAQTAALMKNRFPGSVSLLASSYADSREHAFDALAIACAWVDKAGVSQSQNGRQTGGEACRAR